MAGKRALVVLNMKSGVSGASADQNTGAQSKNQRSSKESADTPQEQALALLKKRGFNFDLIKIEKDVDLGAEIKKALSKNYDLVIAGGGDGTLSSVAQHLVGKDIPLGLLPLGTLNHLTKDLSIPQDLEEAVDILTSGSVATIDTASVNDKFFLNNSSLGLYPQLVRFREREQHAGRHKWHAFFRALRRVLGRFPLMTVRLIVDGKEIVCRTPLVFVGNNLYDLEGFTLGSRKRLNEGTLSLILTTYTNRWAIFGLAMRALLGRLRANKRFKAYMATEITIETKRLHEQVSLDGEVEQLKPPIVYRIHPKSLRVIVPVESSKPTTAASNSVATDHPANQNEACEPLYTSPTSTLAE